jgi:alpha-glucuronidase
MTNNFEYDGWFQKHALSQNAAALKPALARICIVEHGLVIENAARELKQLLFKMFAIDAVILDAETYSGGATPMPEAIVAGTADALNKTFGLAVTAQKKDGFVIKTSAKKIIIAGENDRAVLYGVYRFLFALARGTLNPETEFADSPCSAIRFINHWDNFDGTIERGYAGKSLFFNDSRFEYDAERIADYARLLASCGINALSMSNVNVRFNAKKFITEEYLGDVAKLAAIFRPFGIRLILSVNFASPYLFGGLDTADPLDEKVAAWWKKTAALVYRYVPDLAGFLVKADSESEPGPFQYGRTHADGANMLGNAVKDYGGTVFWRCFVYNCTQDWRDTSVDRARAAYDHFMPLDGAFAKNVILQIKHGPYDFQVREPVSPLFGAFKKTRYIMELQITQEYTGHQIDLCFLPRMWQDVMDFDTGYDINGVPNENNSLKIKELVNSRIEGFAAVSNTGRDMNWTGHPLAQANLFGYGRLAWNPALTAGEIAEEWSALTFDKNETGKTVSKLLLDSYSTYEKYNAPFGVCFMVEPGLHYGPNIEGYEFSKWGTYHRADWRSVGIERGPDGTAYTEQYAPKNARLFERRETTPENLLLFFHRLPYDYGMKNGETLLQNIYSNHFEGCDEVKEMLASWLALEGRVPASLFAEVTARMEKQLANAQNWRDCVNTYFFRHTGIPDAKGRKIYG